MLGNPWAASHSLTQRAVYDGDKFITSSLGDAFPQNIKFLVNDGTFSNGKKDPKTQKENRFDTSSSISVVSGDIPGDGGGKSCGRLGGLSMLNSGGFVKFAQVYSRRACTAENDGKSTTNTKNEVGLVFFDRELNSLGEHKLTDGNDVHVVSSAKYGKNIVVLFSRSAADTSGTFIPAKYTDSDKGCYIMLVSPSGSVIKNPIELDEIALNNDNLIELADGNVAWTYVTEEGAMKLYKLKTPPSTKPAGETGSTADDVPSTNDDVKDDDGKNNDVKDDDDKDDDDDESSSIFSVYVIWILAYLFNK
jgi:hypothetical protein